MSATDEIEECIKYAAYGGSMTAQGSARRALPQLNALEARAEKYRQALENIVKGNYDNAHEINAARAYAAKVLQ